MTYRGLLAASDCQLTTNEKKDNFTVLKDSVECDFYLQEKMRYNRKHRKKHFVYFTCLNKIKTSFIANISVCQLVKTHYVTGSFKKQKKINWKDTE